MIATEVLIYPVQQPTDVTCSHACLAMVTGLPIERLVDRFGDRSLRDEDEATILTELGILPVPMSPYMLENPMPLAGVYFLTTPSLNRPGDMHRVVAHYAHEEGWTVFDPNEGRDGKQYWGRNALQVGPFNFCEPIYLQPLHAHQGSLERRALYVRAGRQRRGMEAAA